MAFKSTRLCNKFYFTVMFGMYTTQVWELSLKYIYMPPTEKQSEKVRL